MGNILKRIVPQFVKDSIRPIAEYPPLLYTRRFFEVYIGYFFRKIFPICKEPPLRKDFQKYEKLFKNSEKNFIEIIKSYRSEFNWFIGRIYNEAFESVDVELYYSVIRKYKPNLIIEIGSGHSTYFAVQALEKNKRGEIICIDPEPRRSLPREVKHIKKKVEEVNVSFFDSLNSNDILFIDSSHTAEEAKYHTKKILPRISKGVIIHHHDFMFPYNLYYKNNPKKFSEQDVLLDFYWKNRKCYEQLVCASYLRYKNRKLIEELVPSYRLNTCRIPGSLWIKKIM